MTAANGPHRWHFCVKDMSDEIEVIEEESQPGPPEGVIVASNGAWRDAKTGRFVPGGNPINAITEENAAEYHRLWQQKKLAGLLSANYRLAEVAGSSDNGWANVAGAMYDTALDDKSRVAAVQAARLLGEMTGYLGSNGKSGDPAPAAARITLELSPEGLEAARAIIGAARAPQPSQDSDGTERE